MRAVMTRSQGWRASGYRLYWIGAVSVDAVGRTRTPAARGEAEKGQDPVNLGPAERAIQGWIALGFQGGADGLRGLSGRCRMRAVVEPEKGVDARAGMPGKLEPA